MKELDWSTVDREPMTYEYQYTWKDVVLYALGIGARIDELSFIYENIPGGLKVFPSFAVMSGGSCARADVIWVSMFDCDRSPNAPAGTIGRSALA